ncbi:IclR family transcriptional regulator [Amycolatopsis sp. NPDC051903]|uniref:IclR family transcriptional regulator n=1 Tax=Amycolatopsis sp. NPDC051903 TaxID=3363936 RepID=UPI0037BD54DC
MSTDPTPPAESGRTPTPVKSADRVLLVLESLGSRRDRPTLTMLSEELGIPLSSLHGLLRTMQNRGWVETDETGSRYSIGVRALLIGSAYAREDEAVVAARAVMDWLSDETGETVHYGRLEGSDVVYLAKRESKFAVRVHSSIGQRIPAHAASLGKAILAEQPGDFAVKTLTWPLVSLTPHTIVEREALFADLARSRERGYAAEREESDTGLGCVAVTVAGTAHLDALSFAVPVARLEEGRVEELAGLLLEAKAVLAGTATPRGARSPEFLGNLTALNDKRE